MANCSETDEISAWDHGKIATLSSPTESAQGPRTSWLRKSMIAVLEPEVGCGHELLAANPQSAYEAGCEIGEGEETAILAVRRLSTAKVIKRSRRAPDCERAPAA